MNTTNRETDRKALEATLAEVTKARDHFQKQCASLQARVAELSYLVARLRRNTEQTTRDWM